jgi:hypothetical protein
MKKLILILLPAVALIIVTSTSPGRHSAEAAGTAAVSCKSCHADFSTVLPHDHPPVIQGKAPDNCVACHRQDTSGSARKNTYEARIHLAHLPPRSNVDCLVCHKWSPGKFFGFAGKKDSWGKPTKDDLTIMKDMFSSWAGSGHLDNIHARSGITCAGCHGQILPKEDVNVGNNRCLDCHGPLDKLAQKTESKEFKNRNPHKSHLGDIDCTVCHKAHSTSKVYCLDCHKDFNMKIKDAGVKK